MPEWTSGSIYIRPNELAFGERIDRDIHNFDHTTFSRMGWMLVRGRLPNGKEVVTQIASPEARELRRLYALYEPEKLLRPVRFPDKVWEDGVARFDVKFIKQNEPVPEGGEEILFMPTGWHLLIRAEVEHEILGLMPSIFDCTYSHRNPQGEVVLENDGWGPAYV